MLLCSVVFCPDDVATPRKYTPISPSWQPEGCRPPLREVSGSEGRARPGVSPSFSLSGKQKGMFAHQDGKGRIHISLLFSSLAMHMERRDSLMWGAQLGAWSPGWTSICVTFRQIQCRCPWSHIKHRVNPLCELFPSRLCSVPSTHWSLKTLNYCFAISWLGCCPNPIKKNRKGGYFGVTLLNQELERNQQSLAVRMLITSIIPDFTSIFH